MELKPGQGAGEVLLWLYAGSLLDLPLLTTLLQIVGLPYTPLSPLSLSFWHWALPMTYFFAVFLYLERLLVRFLKRTHFVLRTKKEQQHELKAFLENYFKNGHPPCK